eukprot:10795389-Heterocapsa_arctica.AAC.1
MNALRPHGSGMPSQILAPVLFQWVLQSCLNPWFSSLALRSSGAGPIVLPSWFLVHPVSFGMPSGSLGATPW